MEKLIRFLKKAGQIVLVFGTAALVLLYFLGYYDFTFLDRYALLKDDVPDKSSSPFGTFSFSLTEEEETEAAESASPVEGTRSPSGAQSFTTTPVDVTNVSKIYDTSALHDRTSLIRTVPKAEAAGYVLTPADGSYSFRPGKTILAKQVFAFQLPEKYAMSRRMGQKVTIVNPEDGSERYAEVTNAYEARPAIEVYMGYLLLDDGENHYILSADGTPLCRYDADRYVPANARDRDGKALFQRTEEDGKIHYFTLSEDGASFELSEYDPELDGRGLRFDYPASFGQADPDSYTRYRELRSDRLKAEVRALVDAGKKKAEAEAEVGRLHAEDKDTALAEKLFGYETRWDGGTPDDPGDDTVTKRTNPVFTMALPFQNGLAAVTSAENRGCMYFINEAGRVPFSTVSTYLSVYERYETSYLMCPVTDGIESIGFYYFDHGLTRVREQILDYWNYETKKNVRVLEDHDKLIRTDGSEYALPAGFTLCGYSDGAAILEKGGKYGLYDVSGDWIAQPIYDEAHPFLGGLAVLEFSGRSGMIDREGSIVLPFTYDSISQVSDGLIAAYREENGWAVFRMMEIPGEDEPEDAES